MALRAAFDESAHDQGETAEVEASQVAAFHDLNENGLSRAGQPVVRRARGWTFKVSALAAAGVAMIGAVVALKGGVPGLPKRPPYIAAAQGPTKVLPPNDDTVAASNDAGATLLKDNTQSAHVKVVESAEQPVDLNALASPGPAPAAASSAPVDASTGSAVRTTVDTPVVVTTAAPPPPVASQFPEPQPVRPFLCGPTERRSRRRFLRRRTRATSRPRRKRRSPRPSRCPRRPPMRPRTRSLPPPSLLCPRSSRESPPRAWWSPRPTRRRPARSRRRRMTRFNLDRP